jgi:hypothetical protein
MAVIDGTSDRNCHSQWFAIVRKYEGFVVFQRSVSCRRRQFAAELLAKMSGGDAI